jgi:hypothetical protein
MNKLFLSSTILVLFGLQANAQLKVDSGFYHLRNADPREWTEFPEKAYGKELLVAFEVERSEIPTAISLRQYDVKLDWIVELNGHDIGSLDLDEKDLISYYIVDRTVLNVGSNKLRIYSKESVPDDIRVGELTMHPDFISEKIVDGLLTLEVIDEDEKPIPCHLTIINEKRVLQSFATSKGPYAARAGHAYTATGKIQLVLPPGKYTVFAGRGFEFSIDSLSVELIQGKPAQRKLTIKREVNTKGWISCDPHVHTYTHSQHGDATDRERVITLAGEGIELPVITDHNQHISLNAVANRHHVDQHFTLLTGNEVTSKVGHFNVFPIDSTESVKSSTPPNWTGLQANIQSYKHEPKVVILNHARDIHNGFRPHDPSRFLSVAGQRLDGNPMFANAMEVINSGSQQSDWMQLFYDWMHLLNAGFKITPIGSGDSHDVSRFIVGQGRTYIQCNDSVPGSITVIDAVENLVAGKVMVSCGLLTSIKVNGKFGPGETAPGLENSSVGIEVSGPGWTSAQKISLYINGEKYKEELINDRNVGGVKWKGTWTLPKLNHDYHVVAIAEGPGKHMIFWPLAKPYQPSSPDWKPTVIGASGAVWVDADKNEKKESANDYAKEIIRSASKDIGKIIELLKNYDEAVAIQVAALLHLTKVNLDSRRIQNALKKASQQTQSGFAKVEAEIKISNTQ